MAAVRIVDLPDLGAVTDAASVVGELSGVGKFSIASLMAYIAATTPLSSVAGLQAQITALTARVAAIEANYVKTD